MRIAIYKNIFDNNCGADIAVKNLTDGLAERGIDASESISTTKDVIKDIQTLLTTTGKSLVEKRCIDNRTWTQTIIRGLSSLGLDRGFCPYPLFEGDKRVCSEWLYDMTWTKETDEGSLKEIVLALESEWSHRGARYDFQKLVQAKSKIKVFICDYLGDDLHRRLIDDIKEFTPRDQPERYMIAEYSYANRNTAPFTFFVYDGEGNSVTT